MSFIRPTHMTDPDFVGVMPQGSRVSLKPGGTEHPLPIVLADDTTVGIGVLARPGVPGKYVAVIQLAEGEIEFVSDGTAIAVGDEITLATDGKVKAGGAVSTGFYAINTIEAGQTGGIVYGRKGE